MIVYQRRRRRNLWPVWWAIIVLGMAGAVVYWWSGPATVVVEGVEPEQSPSKPARAEWRWPTRLDNAVTLTATEAPRRMRFVARQPMEVFPVADGELLFSGTISPIGGPLLAVLEHANDVWTTYTFNPGADNPGADNAGSDEFAPWLERARSTDGWVRGTTRLAEIGSFELLIWDAVTREPLNPRYLLPHRPVDSRPGPLELVFIQHGQIRLANDPGLHRGRATVALRGAPARLIDGPMRVVVMRGATRIGEVYRDAGLFAAGPQVVGEFDLPLGRTVLDLVSHGFDGATVSRRVTVSAVEPPVLAE